VLTSAGGSVHHVIEQDVGSVGMISVPLMANESPLAAGEYRLDVSAADGAQRRSLRLRMERVAVDTAALEPPLPDSLFLPTQRRGGVSRSALIRGLVIAGAAVAVPAMFGNSELGDSRIRSGALVIGGAISLGSILGSVAGRPMVSIEDNIRANESLRSAWESRRAAAVAGNEQRRRFAPLRILAEPLP
jgi:hypothetical protein